MLVEAFRHSQGCAFSVNASGLKILLTGEDPVCRQEIELVQKPVNAISGEV